MIKALTVALILLLVVSAFLLYLLVDRSLTATYMSASLDTEQQRFGDVARLMEDEWKNKSMTEVTNKLNAYVKSHPEAASFVKYDESDKTLRLNQIQFVFENDRLVQVR